MKATLLKPLYKKAVDGLPLLGTPNDVAQRFSTGGHLDTGRLIAFYTSLSGTSGFVFGLPGFLLLPLTLPANVGSVALLQLHMVASLAVMGGHDLDDPETRDAVMGCLLEKLDAHGKNSEEEEVVTRTGVKLLQQGASFVAGQAMKMAGKAARSVALRKIGLRRIPMAGGLIGGGTDAYVTHFIGRCARQTFLDAA